MYVIIFADILNFEFYKTIIKPALEPPCRVAFAACHTVENSDEKKEDSRALSLQKGTMLSSRIIMVRTESR